MVEKARYPLLYNTNNVKSIKNNTYLDKIFTHSSSSSSESQNHDGNAVLLSDATLEASESLSELVDVFFIGFANVLSRVVVWREGVKEINSSSQRLRLRLYLRLTYIR